MARQRKAEKSKLSTVTDVQRIVTEFRKEFHDKVTVLSDSVMILNPLNDDDAKLIETTIKMLQSIDREIQGAETAAQLQEVVDVERLVNNWDIITNLLSEGEYSANILAHLFDSVNGGDHK